jgi:nucleoid-associated protein YgaU
VRGDRPSAAASSNSQDSPTTEAPAPGEALQPDIATAVEAVPPVEAAAPPTLEQAALTPSDSSVIIRRGDTLWQISRRVYGQGVRYTTIYLANEAQISNPDRILPGQVFSVPDDALDNAEELHRERLRNLRGG